MTTDPAQGAFFLQRLQRLRRIRRDYTPELNEIGAQLLSRAITATIGDCYDHGVGEIANKIMQGVPHDGRDAGISGQL